MPPKIKGRLKSSSTNEDDIKMTLNEIIDMLNDLKNENRELKEEIKSLRNDLFKNDVTYSQITAHKVGNNNEPVIIIKPKNNQESQITKSEIKKKVNPSDMSVGISMVKECKHGAIVIGCENREGLGKLKSSITEQLGSNYNISQTKLKKPRVKVFNVEKVDTENDNELFQKIFNQNDIKQQVKCNDVKMSVIFKKDCINKRECNVIIETDPALHKVLIEKEKINIGWKRCRVENYVSVVRCFNCSRYGHMKAECKSETPVCPFCMEDHVLQECKADKMDFKCVNCKYANDKFKLNLNYNHCALDKQCPSWLNVVRNMQRKIDYAE